MKAMILAAGRGERMRPLTDHTAKALLPVGGKPLIVWQIERLVAAGITGIVINHAHLGAQIEAALGDGSGFGARITYSPEVMALETAGGVVNAMPLLGEHPFIVVSADIYAECDYRALATQGQAVVGDGASAYLWMVDNPAWHPEGDFAFIDGHLHLQGVPRLTYANLGVFHPSFFADVERGTKLPMLPLFKKAIADKSIRAACYEGVWDNIGTPAQLAALDTLLRERRPASSRQD
jgi:N-acetyl-alpha-D-muramate 1-phosphate uridylyltransferase